MTVLSLIMSYSLTVNRKVNIEYMEETSTVSMYLVIYEDGVCRCSGANKHIVDIYSPHNK